MRTFQFLALGTALLLFSGCGGDKGRPKDLPKLHPVSLTITQEDKPLEGAIVTVVSKTPTTYSTASGTTDASGTAKLMTYGFDGVPTGEYAVLVEKRVTEGAKETTTQEGASMMVGGQVFQYVDPKFTKEKDTTLNLSVGNKAVKETYEVGAAVHELLFNQD